MAWLPLAADDLLSAVTQPERDLFGSGDSASSSPDRLEQIVTWVVDQVRGKVAACAENRDVMGANGTIPAELYGDAIAICRFQLLTSFPAGRSFLDEGRMRAYSDALKHLDDAAACTIAIEPPVPGDVYTPDSSAFGSRDDALCDPTLQRNRNVIDFGFSH
jgi:hypothetical protein